MIPTPDPLVLARALVDIDSTTGREGEAGALARRLPARPGWRVVEQPVDGDRVERLRLDRRATDRRLLHPLRLRAAVLSEPRWTATGCTAAGRATRRAFSPRRWRPPNGSCASGETRVGLLFVVGEERGSDGAKAANRMSPPGCRYLVNGEPTDNRLGPRDARRAARPAARQRAGPRIPRIPSWASRRSTS